MKRIEDSALINAAHLLEELEQLAAGRRGQRLRGLGVASDRLRADRRAVLRRAVVELVAAGFHVKTLKNLSATHLTVAVDAWRARGLRGGTIRTYSGYLKILCRWLNKPQLITHLKRLIEPERRLAHRSTAHVKAAHARRSITDVFAEATALDQRFACILLLMATFGLTAREAWCVRPWRMPVTEHTGALVQWAQTFADTPQRAMIPPADTLSRWRRRFYRHCRRINLTRTGGGLTPQLLYHRLRAAEVSLAHLLRVAQSGSVTVL